MLLALTLIGSFLIPSLAQATNYGDDDDDETTATATATGGGATADSNAGSESYSGAESESSSGASADNVVAVTYTRPATTTVRNVASPDTPNVYPSAPCRIARSAGLSLAGGSLSGGSSVEDVECTLRETARAFQYLGVPEVGLHLLCTQSIVVTGRRDKKGDLEEGATPPLGAQECLRLVRDFQGDLDDTDAEVAHSVEIQELREQQNSLERRFAERAAELAREHEETQQVVARRATPVVRQETVQQPMFNAEQRSYIQSLKIETNEETEQ